MLPGLIALTGRSGSFDPFTAFYTDIGSYAVIPPAGATTARCIGIGVGGASYHEDYYDEDGNYQYSSYTGGGGGACAVKTLPVIGALQIKIPRSPQYYESGNDFFLTVTVGSSLVLQADYGRNYYRGDEGNCIGDLKYSGGYANGGIGGGAAGSLGSANYQTAGSCESLIRTSDKVVATPSNGSTYSSGQAYGGGAGHYSGYLGGPAILIIKWS